MIHIIAKKPLQSSYFDSICKQLLNVLHAKPCERHLEFQSGRRDRRQTIMMAPHLTQERQERLPGENNTQAEIEQMDRRSLSTEWEEKEEGFPGKRNNRRQEKRKGWHVPKWPPSKHGESRNAGHMRETRKKPCRKRVQQAKGRNLDCYHQGLGEN